MQLSIVILSYNTREILRNCLDSIAKSQVQLEYEVIVVDNASSDGSPDMIEADFAHVSLIRNRVNNLYSKANNQAIEIAKGDYILLLNSDCIVEAGNIEKMYKFAVERGERLGAVSPRVLNKDRTVQMEGSFHETVRSVLCTAFGVLYWPIPRLLKKRILPLGYSRFMTGETRQVGWAAGCCLLISKALIHKIGGLDEGFIFYHEDVEWCYRARRNGYVIWVLPEAEVIHLGGASTDSVRKENVSNNRVDQRIYYYSKTIGLTNAIAVNALIMTLYSCLGIVLGVVKSTEKSLFMKQYAKSSAEIFKALLNAR